MYGFLRRQKQIVRNTGEELRSAAVRQPFVRWRILLTWFARIVAMLWLMKGLAAWATIFGVLADDNEFLLRGIDFQAAVVFFAVVDLIAAVGLWMVSSWGGVIWLISVLSYITISSLFRDVVPAVPLVSWVLGALVLVYLVLSWLAAREEMH